MYKDWSKTPFHLQTMSEFITKTTDCSSSIQMFWIVVTLSFHIFKPSDSHKMKSFEMSNSSYILVPKTYLKKV